MNTYDLKQMRIELIKVLTGTLNKSSRWYKDDYETICAAVNRKTRKELMESLGRQMAVLRVSNEEINRHCNV